MQTGGIERAQNSEHSIVTVCSKFSFSVLRLLTNLVLLIATINIYHIKAPVTTHEEDLDLKLSECVLLKLFSFSLR